MTIRCPKCQHPLLRLASIETATGAEFRTRCTNPECGRQVSVRLSVDETETPR